MEDLYWDTVVSELAHPWGQVLVRLLVQEVRVCHPGNKCGEELRVEALQAVHS